MTRIVHGMALHTGLSVRLARRNSSRAIIMLHGVGDADLSQADFAAAMQWLARHFRVLSLSTLLRHLQRGLKPAPEGEVALTFDDGLRNHAELAYPVLRALRLPATFFVCPGLIEAGRWLWNHEARSRLRRLPPDELVELASDLQTAPKIEAIIAWMKTLPLEQRQRAEQRIREATPHFQPTQQERAAYDLMGWNDLRGLEPKLITIGSHTVSHPILSTLEDVEIRHELIHSRVWLEKELAGRVVDLFCYPNGSQDARVRGLAAQTYRAAVSTVEGRVDVDVDWHAIPRVPVAAELPLMAWRMHRPGA